MATVPAVYVTIEDRSFTTPTVRSGRSGLIVIPSDRGPHNRIVEINSLQEFIDTYGKPDILKYGQAHYLAAKFLERSNQLYVIRPSILDSANEENNASIANQYIKFNDPNGSEQLVMADKFIFTNEVDAGSNTLISKYVFTNKSGFDIVEVGNYIYSEKDSIVEKVKVVSKNKLTNVDVYYFELDRNYVGTSTVDVNNGNALLVTLTGVDNTDINNYNININNDFISRIYTYYPGSFETSGKFKFKNGSDVVTAKDINAFNEITVESWIYPDLSESKYARQVINKNITNDGIYQLLLDMNFEGPNSVDFELGRKYIPYEILTLPNLKDHRSIDEQDSDNLWYFYANGTGSYYNNIFIRGVRNTYYEKMYLDDNGTPLYRYSFMDITIYRSNEDGNSTILEGPWTVSLMDKVGEQTVRDLSTGKELYIIKVINERSKIISCKESETAASILNKTDIASEYKRLQIQSIFSSGTVYRMKTKGLEGFFLENGTDGIIFDSYGRFNLENSDVLSTFARCYDGTFKSIDGSIESILQTIYPWYTFDYIICGGYPLEIQKFAVDLANIRNDCMVLADTGGLYYEASSDIAIRKELLTWNTWNAMVYTQYRKIFDKYTGKQIWVTPVYHAIDCHLRIDNDVWISEPVAGYVKGSVTDNITIAYKSDMIHMEEMLDIELNPTIVEPDGKYFLTQNTTYKPLSIMKQASTVKFVHYLYKTIPKLLKDLLQRKATSYWIGQATTRLNSYMNQFKKEDTKYEAISTFSVSVQFSEDSSELYVALSIRPLRTITAIRVNIVVA